MSGCRRSGWTEDGAKRRPLAAPAEPALLIVRGAAGNTRGFKTFRKVRPVGRVGGSPMLKPVDASTTVPPLPKVALGLLVALACRQTSGGPSLPTDFGWP
jgi:hypothetical protein